MTNQRRERGPSAIREHLGNPQSTHGKAAEASAARLLRVLRLAYPTIQGRELTEGSVSMEPTADIRAAQGSLIAYLQAKIAGRDEDFSAIRDNPHIKDTIRLIDAISANPRLTPAEKIKVWRQMISIASTCPGLSWDASHERWSTNHIYNPLTMVNDLVIASPAETMNLVCAAILDVNRYATDNEADLGFRIESFYTRLLNLQTQEEVGQLQFCAAGRQHEMLFLLNMSYLDKPREEAGASPIQLIENTDAFLVHSLSSYIESELSAVSAEIRGRVVLDSLRSQSNLIQIDEYPLITWLHEKHEGRWKEDCMRYLAKRCIDFGIDPRQCKLDDIIASLEYLPLPATGQMLEPMMAEIFTAAPFPVRVAEAGGVATRIDGWSELVLAANAALDTIKRTLTPATYESQGPLIRDFYKTLEAMKSLNHYKDLRVFVGAEEGAFNAARDDLQRALLAYYTDFNLERRLTPEFEVPLQRYLTEKKAFNQRSQVDYVENSFAALFVGENLIAWLNRLQALRPADADKHPLELSDDVLERWYSESVVPGAEGDPPTMDVSAYQINRILLHALLVAPNHWTPRYAESLQLVTEWLLQPKKPGEAILNTLKDSYPEPILSNLLLLTLLNRPSFRQDAVKGRLNALFENKLYFFDLNFLQRLIQQNTMEETTDLFSAIQGQLGLYIRNYKDLIYFFETDRLNNEHKTPIWEAVQGRLVDLIQDGTQLKGLLSLPESKLSAEHKTQIWEAVQGRLVDLIKDGYQLKGLLSLPESKLSAEHKTQIWEAVQGRLVDLIKEGYQLGNLLSLPDSQLSAEHKTQIWEDVQGRLVDLIKDGYQLKGLLSLPESQLSAEHKSQIWEAVQGRLVDLIQNLNQVWDLLSFPESQLNAEHKTQLLRAIEERLGVLIYHGDNLRFLLSLPESQLSAVHRTHILTAIESRLDNLIENKYQLRNLLSLPESQLNAEHRTLIWRALKGRLALLIQEEGFESKGMQLITVLSAAQLNAEHRALIVRDVCQCLSMFSLSPNQRRVILHLIFPDRPIPIEHFIELLKVTPLDVYTLSREMRVTKEDVVAYIRGLNDREKVILIKQIFDERHGAGLHAFFAIQRG